MDNNHTTPSYLCCLLLLLLLAACASRSTVGEQLLRADSLLDSHPDSALRLLESIAPDSLPTEADSAYYALLLTQARDKNYIPQTDDSLIRSAARYYDRQQDAPMQARAYYLWGGVCRDRNQQGAAVDKYLTAIQLAKEVNDLLLLARIYNQVGCVYYVQGLFAKSDSIYRETERLSVLLQDTNLMISALTWQGKAITFQRRYKEAEAKLLKAESLLEKANVELTVRAGVFSALSAFYGQTHEGEKAVRYARINLDLQSDTLYSFNAFMLLGDAYYWVHQYDSAIYYVEKSTSSPHYSDKANSYMRLADIAKKQGDIERSLELERILSACRDSAALYSQKGAVLQAEEAFKVKQLHTRHAYHLQWYRYAIVAGGVLGIGVLCWLYGYYRRKIHRQQQETLAKEEELSKWQEKDALRQTTQQTVDELKIQRTRLLQEILTYSDVYTKLQRILAGYKEKGYSKESLTDVEWKRLMLEIDPKEALRDFGVKHGLEQKEIYYCYLLLLEFSASDRARILHIVRSTVYRIESRICQKLGIPPTKNATQDLLKSISATLSHANATLCG